MYVYAYVWVIVFVLMSKNKKKKKFKKQLQCLDKANTVITFEITHKHIHTQANMHANSKEQEKILNK